MRLQDYNSMDEILDRLCTSKEGKKSLFADIGSPDNNYSSFKSRYSLFKDWIKDEIPNFTSEEIIKYHKYNQEIKKVRNWYAFDRMLTILEWEELKKYGHEV
jgi:hypothetical protein